MAMAAAGVEGEGKEDAATGAVGFHWSFAATVVELQQDPTALRLGSSGGEGRKKNSNVHFRARTVNGAEGWAMREVGRA
jgi:hypothetical protein